MGWDHENESMELGFAGNMTTWDCCVVTSRLVMADPLQIISLNLYVLLWRKV